MSDASEGIGGEAQFDVLELEQPLVLLSDRVARPGQDLDQSIFIQIVENSHHRQAAHKFGNQPELDQILGLGPAQQFTVAFGGANQLLLALGFVGAEPHRPFSDPPADHPFQADKCASADK